VYDDLDDLYDPEDADPAGNEILTDDFNNNQSDDCNDLTTDGKCGRSTNLDRPEPRSLTRILISIEFIFAIGSGSNL